MKKLLLVISIGLVVFASSCKKDSTQPAAKATDTTKTNTNTNTTTTTTTTTTKTPAEITADNKAAMETQGTAFGNEITTIKSTKASLAIQNLTSLFSSSSTKAGLVESSLPVGKLLSSFSSNTSGGIVTALKSGTTSTVDFKSEISKYALTYTYNPSTKKFDTSAAESANVLKVLFPGSSDSQTNNAEFKIYGMAFSTVSTTNTLYSANNAITACSAYLKVDGTNAMTYGLSVTYDASGYPSNLSTNLTVDTYSLTYNLTYTSAKFTSDLSFKHGDVIIMAEGSELDGTLTEAKAKELNTYYNDSTVASHNAAKIGQFVNTATVYYQVMDIKIVGSVDALNFTTAIDGLSQSDKDNFNQTDADLVNKYCSLYGIFASTNKKIADITIYAKTPTTGTVVQPAFMLTFPDGSKSDLQTYVTDPNNFAGLRSQINSLIPKKTN